MKAHEDTWEYLSGEWPPTVRRQGTNDKIADVWGDGLDTHEPADLIAAAPEMARVLLGILPYFEKVEPVDPETAACIEDARAVLRKAGVLGSGHT